MGIPSLGGLRVAFFRQAILFGRHISPYGGRLKDCIKSGRKTRLSGALYENWFNDFYIGLTKKNAKI
ncbi:MAG: hypothetical protein J5828_06420 [Desulfovibrionaceae bacterium]|nr:hypothetical protein [Desulfovibrionaceae bacterium]